MFGLKLKLSYIPQRTLNRNIMFDLNDVKNIFGDSIYNMNIVQYLNEQCSLDKHRGQIDCNDGFKEEGLGVVER